MLEQVLMHLRNWFCVGVYDGTFVAKNGGIDLPFLKPGQFFRVVGSVFNDGVYKYGDINGLQDETFTGSVWALAVPAGLLSLVSEIETWQLKNAKANGPYQSESFADYSYTLRFSSEGEDATTWEGAFRKRLNNWRKL